ncbi:MAG: hypothetical protein LBP50_01640 [Tannerella sp.]|jgi:hypothetical protein|nr:hypothetical protein [Tannerella sp.]
MILCAVDGSAVPLPETEELKEKYGCAKNQLPGLSKVCIEQDFAAALCLFNLQSLTEKPVELHARAVGRRRKYRCKVSGNVSRGLLTE